jgi:hypothetical protein
MVKRRGAGHPGGFVPAAPTTADSEYSLLAEIVHRLVAELTQFAWVFR